MRPWACNSSIISAIKIPVSIITDPATPTPVAPKNPDDTYAAAFHGYPSAKRANPNPIPTNAPSRGNFLAVALAIALVINF